MSKIKVVHYINQFFANIGGEEMAHVPAEMRVGEVVGPGLAFAQAFGEEAEITATIICGDSFFNENLEEAKASILAMVKEHNPDVFIAGPAFNAGRYGVACGTVCEMVQDELGIKAVTGMYEENPGADMFKNKVYTVATKNSAAGMRAAVKSMAPLALKLAKGEKIGASCEEGYMPNGIRVNLFEQHTKTINFVCHIITNENVYLADKMRSSDWTAKMCRFLDLDAVIVSQEGFGNPDTDLIMNTKKIEAEGVKTVIITDEYAGRDGKSQSLADSDPAADAVVTGGNANQVVILPKLDKVIGTLDYVNTIAGGNEHSLREDGTIEVEIQAITGATNETGFNYLSAR